MAIQPWVSVALYLLVAGSTLGSAALIVRELKPRPVRGR